MKEQIKLKNLIRESWYDDSKKLTSAQKSEFLNTVSKYNSLGKALYSEYNLVEIAKQLVEIAQSAEIIALASPEDDFDKITIERNMKELKSMATQFSKIASEAQALTRRLTAYYEDVGNILGRYFDIASEDGISLPPNNSYSVGSDHE